MQEFQAVILADANDGDNLYPLTEQLPLPLLPIANRPLISYQLQMLERAHGFTEVIVVVHEHNYSQLLAYAAEGYKGRLKLDLVVVPEGAGSADALRHIKGKLHRDFVLISGDVISDVPFQQIADRHRVQGAAVTALFKEQSPRDPQEKKRAKELDGADFVGLDDRKQRLLYLESGADCDGGLITVSQSLLAAHPHLQVHTRLTDAHVYIFAHWTISILEMKPHFVSVKFELLPYLVRKQFLSLANLSQMPPPPTPTPGVNPQLSAPTSPLRCCCYVVAHDAGYCTRVNSIPTYTQANLDLSRGGVAQLEKAAEPPETAKDGNFASRSFSSDCAKGVGVEVGARSTIKKSAVGPHCRIGANVKISNCVLMDHVVVHDKVTMSNVVVCSDAEIGEGASLKDAQVGKAVSIEAGAELKGEAIVEDSQD